MSVTHDRYCERKIPHCTMQTKYLKAGIWNMFLILPKISEKEDYVTTYNLIVFVCIFRRLSHWPNDKRFSCTSPQQLWCEAVSLSYDIILHYHKEDYVTSCDYVIATGLLSGSLSGSHLMWVYSQRCWGRPPKTFYKEIHDWNMICYVLLMCDRD